MEIAHLQNDVVDRTLTPWRSDDELTVFDLHSVSEHAALLFGVVEELEPM
jgi:hypothetical protein